MRNDAPPDYVQRVNRAIDLIERRLDGSLPLEEVARAASFSPFHFHRIFKSMTGETLAQFVKRRRIERALSIMSRAPERPLTRVALDCGFSGSSDFSRAFKQHFGVPPSAFNVDTWRAQQRETLNATMEGAGGPRLERLPPGENPDGFRAHVLTLPARTVAYIRVHDPYRSDAVPRACERLVAWADERALADGQWLGYMWDDPEVVPIERCYYDVGLVVDPERVRTELPAGEIGLTQFPKLRVAQLTIDGDIELEQRALDWLFGTWLPLSGEMPDSQPAFEVWIGRPFAHGMERFTLHLHLPVVRAR